MTDSKKKRNKWTTMICTVLLIIYFTSCGDCLNFTLEGAMGSNNTFRPGSSATLVCVFNITSDVTLTKGGLAAVTCLSVTCLSSLGKCDVNSTVMGSYSISFNSSGIIRLNIPLITTQERDVPFACTSSSSKETITLHVEDRPVVFESRGSTDGNNTFLLGSNATLVCRTEIDQINIVFRINNTPIVDCSINICEVSKNISGRYIVSVNNNFGQIDLHIPSVSVEDTYNNFTCESSPNVNAIQLKTLKDKEHGGSTEEQSTCQCGKDTAGIVLGVLFAISFVVNVVLAVVMYRRDACRN